MSRLYMVATPIGNLEDMTHRAVRVLQEVDRVICEDTRRAKILFDAYGIDTQRVSCHAQTGPEKIAQLVEDIARGSTAAYISDAGTPGVSDPGFRLVRAASQRDITIIPIPGASATLSLLSVSNVPTSPLQWHGFLPHKKGRVTLIQQIIDSDISHLLYESVHRFPKFLRQMMEAGGADRYINVGRELTKMHEEIFRGTVKQAVEHFNDLNTRGEFAILIAPSSYRP